MKRQEMKSALEAILFVWGNAVDIKSAAEVFQITPKEAADILEELRHEYESRESGLMIRRIGKSYQIVRGRSRKKRSADSARLSKKRSCQTRRLRSWQ